MPFQKYYEKQVKDLKDKKAKIQAVLPTMADGEEKAMALMELRYTKQELNNYLEKIV